MRWRPLAGLSGEKRRFGCPRLLFSLERTFMKRYHKERWATLGLAGLLCTFVVCGGSPGEENAEAPAPDAVERAEAAPAPEAPAPAPAVSPMPSGMLRLNTVVATVNSEAITLDDLYRDTRDLLVAEEKNWPPEKWLNIKLGILKAELENLIDKKLILMEVRELGARIEDSSVREYIRGIPELRTTFEGDLGKFLVANGLTYSKLYKDVEEYLLFTGILREKVLPKVRVPPEEVRRYYERNIDRFTEEGAIHCFAICFLKRDNPEEAAAVLTKAREALRKINEGAYFPDVAKEYSEDPTKADKGGDWGWITPGALEKKASEAAFALKEGEYSGVLQADVAYWILWVKEKRDSSVIPLSAAWKEIELGVKTRKQDMEIRRWGRRLRLKAAITYPVPLSEVVRR